MRSAYLDDADPDAVSHAVRRVLEARGALVREHRHSRIRFAGLGDTGWSWERSGYVGLFQRLGEREMEVRLRLRAAWPYRLLWATALVNVLAALTTIVMHPDGTTWVLVAILGGFALLASGLVHVGTLRHVREEERSLMEGIETELAQGSGVVVGQDARSAADEEAQLAAELEARRLARERKAAPPKPREAKAEKKRRFALRPRKEAPPPAEPEAAPAAEETPEERRARLLARKAELEARRREGGT